MAAVSRKACLQGPQLASGNLICEEFPTLIWKVPDTGKVPLPTEGTKPLLPSEILALARWRTPTGLAPNENPKLLVSNGLSLGETSHTRPRIFTVRKGSTERVSPWPGRDSIESLWIDFSRLGPVGLFPLVICCVTSLCHCNEF